MKEEREKRQPSGDYEVGYCRPPVDTRWKPGECGRPEAKRRKKKNNGPDGDISLLLRQELLREIKLPENGSVVKVRLIDVLAKQLINDALKGTPAQHLKLFSQLNQMGLLTPSIAEHQAAQPNLEELVAWLVDRPSEV